MAIETPTTNADDTPDYSSQTWLSLIGLLDPWEFLFTVDHFTIWHKHVTWSKPTGEELLKYRTQRLSSNMVFLSLILATDISTLFNSSAPCNAMRKHMHDGDFFNTNYWIGSIVVVSAFVTLIGLVANFTVWGMLSSISCVNSRALLRSNIGQYVTSLPSRFVVASLYLFVLWLLLFVGELLNGILVFIVVPMVLFIFFQVVVSLSAFGRLIIHTGAMGARPVLDPEFEKNLLPSGLHASLLIKATARKRKKAGVISMYNKPRDQFSSFMSEDSERSFVPYGHGTSLDSSVGTLSTRSEMILSSRGVSDAFKSSSKLDNIQEESCLETTPQDLTISVTEGTPQGSLPPSLTRAQSGPTKPSRRRQKFSHHRVLSTTTDFSFPLPEILNQNNGDMNALLQMTLDDNSNNASSVEEISMEEKPQSDRSLSPTRKEPAPERRGVTPSPHQGLGLVREEETQMRNLFRQAGEGLLGPNSQGPNRDRTSINEQSTFLHEWDEGLSNGEPAIPVPSSANFKTERKRTTFSDQPVLTNTDTNSPVPKIPNQTGGDLDMDSVLGGTFYDRDRRSGSDQPRSIPERSLHGTLSERALRMPVISEGSERSLRSISEGSSNHRDSQQSDLRRNLLDSPVKQEIIQEEAKMLNHRSSFSKRDLQLEWSEEAGVRDLYDVERPAQIDFASMEEESEVNNEKRLSFLSKFRESLSNIGAVFTEEQKGVDHESENIDDTESGGNYYLVSQEP